MCLSSLCPAKSISPGRVAHTSGCARLRAENGVGQARSVVERVLLERDVSNDKFLADQALIASEAQYRRLFESAQDGS